MRDDERRRYVESALVANGYRFEPARVDAIVEQFARIEAIRHRPVQARRVR